MVVLKSLVGWVVAKERVELIEWAELRAVADCGPWVVLNEPLEVKVVASQEVGVVGCRVEGELELDGALGWDWGGRRRN